MQKQLLDLFGPEELFHDSQYGFRKGRSCEDVLLIRVEKWRLALDKGKTVAIAFLDISKAFDNVDQQRLLLKLKSLNISGTVLM